MVGTACFARHAMVVKMVVNAMFVKSIYIGKVSSSTKRLINSGHGTSAHVILALKLIQKRFCRSLARLIINNRKEVCCLFFKLYLWKTKP